LDINDLTYKINGAVFKVSRVLGAGFLEKVKDSSINDLKRGGVSSAIVGSGNISVFICVFL
jgi:hypothetical protein